MQPKIKNLIKEIFFPEDFTCDICGVETFGDNLCPQCKSTVIFNDKNTCPYCGRKTVRPEICLECKEKPPLYRKAVSAVVYGEGGAKLIHKFKNGYGYLKDFFAAQIAEKIKNLPQPDFIVYVPMSKRSRKRRGYNQTELLAHALSEITGIPAEDGIIVKIKETREQKGLSRKERAENLKGCFKAESKDKIKGRRILIVDDVLTTGATADAICKVLLSAGAKETYFASFASTEYKLPQT